MNKLKVYIILILIFLVVGGWLVLYNTKHKSQLINSNQIASIKNSQFIQTANPLSITVMRENNYPGSNLIIEKTLSDGVNYNQYIASYQSEGLKIYGLLTKPYGDPPLTGWPVIIFVHGYIPPQSYKTTERYVAYVNAFAKNGYMVFKPDLRGNGSSEGQPEGAYYSPAYAADVLNALTSIKIFKDVNPDKIGIWGHSMGGNIALRDLVVDNGDFKAAVIWGGVVGSYNDLINNWQHKVRYQPPPQELALRNNNRQKLINTYGTPQTNPSFWQSIDPTFYLTDIQTPIQLHTGGNDEEVPVIFSANLKDKLVHLGKTVEYYNYPGGDHNISSPNFELAMQRSIDFFNKYLKD